MSHVIQTLIVKFAKSLEILIHVYSMRVKHVYMCVSEYLYIFIDVCVCVCVFEYI